MIYKVATADADCVTWLQFLMIIMTAEQKSMAKT